MKELWERTSSGICFSLENKPYPFSIGMLQKLIIKEKGVL